MVATGVARRRIRGWAVVACFASAGFLGARTGDETGQGAKVEGTLMVDGTTVALGHAYSRTEEYLDKKLPVVLLSDQPIAAEALASTDAWEPFDSLAREQKARTVRLRFDDRGEIVKIWIHDPAFDGALQAHPPGVFERRRFDRGGIAGTYRMAAPDEFFTHRWKLDVTFETPMPAGAAVP